MGTGRRRYNRLPDSKQEGKEKNECEMVGYLTTTSTGWKRWTDSLIYTEEKLPLRLPPPPRSDKVKRAVLSQVVAFPVPALEHPRLPSQENSPTGPLQAHRFLFSFVTMFTT